MVNRHVHFKGVTSTNDVALDLAQQGAEHLTCVTADVQTKGRGRRGRVWTTIPNKSVAASFVVRQLNHHLLPFAISLAVAETCEHWVGEVQIKWPNDILIKGHKASGVLIERHSADDQTPFYIVGIGINVNKYTADELATPYPTTSLEDHASTTIAISDVVNLLAHRVAYWVATSHDDVLEHYKKSCITLGKRVEWRMENKSILGQAISMDESGALILKLEDGAKQKVLSGDIIIQNG